MASVNQRRKRGRAPVPVTGEAVEQGGVHQTELIKKSGPWKTLADVELATAGYVEWFNARRLHAAIGGVPPAEYEAAYYAQTQPPPEAGPKN